MRFDATEEQLQLQTITRRFLEDTVPLTTVRLWSDKSPAGFDRDWWRRACDLGWTSLLVHESRGGSAAAGDGLSGLADLAIVAEERGRLVSPGPLVPAAVAAWTLASADADAGGGAGAGASSGVEAEVGLVLEGILAGTSVCAWVVGEGEQSWLTSPPGVTGVARGTSLELTGNAHAVESGADSDCFLVAVDTADGIVHVLVPAQSAGLRHERGKSLDLVRRHADLRFEGVVVPPSKVIVGAERGRAILERQRQIANVMQCAEMVGAASSAFDLTLSYAGERYSFGRPLASYQVLKHRLADMKLWIEASQAAVEGAVEALGQGAPSAAQLVSSAKLYVGRKAPNIVQDCIQMHGGIGVTWEHDLHLYLRRVTTERQLMGTPADHALYLASLLGL